jgi:hypothetical protein
LVNDHRLMGELVNRPASNVIAGATTALLVLLSLALLVMSL